MAQSYVIYFNLWYLCNNVMKQKPARIELRGESISDVPSGVRTPGKDDAARYIINEVLNKGRWPMDYTDMAEESGWSRQHIKNTLDDYFVGEDPTYQNTSNPDGSETQVGTDMADNLNISIPGDVERQDYLAGFVDGYLKAKQ